MEFNLIKQSYQDQLIKAGVSPQRAEEAASVLNHEELQLISEIWSDWAAVFSQLTNCPQPSP
jgi:hypothetical protein